MIEELERAPQWLEKSLMFIVKLQDEWERPHELSQATNQVERPLWQMYKL